MHVKYDTQEMKKMSRIGFCQELGDSSRNGKNYILNFAGKDMQKVSTRKIKQDFEFS